MTLRSIDDTTVLSANLNINENLAFEGTSLTLYAASLSDFSKISVGEGYTLSTASLNEINIVLANDFQYSENDEILPINESIVLNGEESVNVRYVNGNSFGEIGKAWYLINDDTQGFGIGFAAIPEPSTFAAIAGVFALGMAAWCRHK